MKTKIQTGREMAGSEVDAWLRLAVRALAKEDALLAKAFKGSAAAKSYKTVNQGLGYWLYETALVYTIFKAWIPELHVVWDWPEERQEKARHDLRVLKGTKTTHLFEAKWCNTAAGTRSLLSDAKKIRQGRGRAGYLVAFRSAPSTKWAKDLEWAKDQARELGAEEDYFFGTFPTHNVSSSRAKDYYFATAAFRVRKVPGR